MSKVEFSSKFGNLAIADDEIEELGKSSIKGFLNAMRITTPILVIIWALVVFYLFYDTSSVVVVLVVVLSLLLAVVIGADIYLAILKKDTLKLGTSMIKKNITKIQNASGIPFIIGVNKNVYLRSISDYHNVLEFCMPSSSAEKKGKPLQNVPLENVEDMYASEFEANKSVATFRLKNPSEKIEVNVKGIYNYLSTVMFIKCATRFRDRFENKQ